MSGNSLWLIKEFLNRAKGSIYTVAHCLVTVMLSNRPEMIACFVLLIKKELMIYS